MGYDILNAGDIHRFQALPFYIREVLGFVYYRHSMTAKIRNMTGFHLQVLRREPYRDVRILNGENLLMYARTKASHRTQVALRGIYSFQKKLPIGDFLFHCQDVKRRKVSLRLCLIPPLWLSEYEEHSRLFWVRQTHWYYQGRYRITLIEVFV